MRSHQDEVHEFHAKHGFAIGSRLTQTRLENDFMSEVSDGNLLAAADIVETLSVQWSKGQPGGMHPDDLADRPEDVRLTRAHLILEEAAEVLRALANRDRVQLLDGLADLAYVTFGTAVAYGLPLDAALVEVHRSNMTKERQADDPENVRMRDKGPNYEPPDLRRVLEEHHAL